MLSQFKTPAYYLNISNWLILSLYIIWLPII